MSLRPVTPGVPRLRPMPPPVRGQGAPARPPGGRFARVGHFPPEARVVVPGRLASDLWWLHPLTCVALIAAVYAGFMAFDFLRVVPKAYIPSWDYAWGFALLLALAVGIATMTFGREPPAAARPDTALDVPPWAMGVLLAATLFAYALWFGPLFADPGLFVEILLGARTNLRDTVSTQPGVTTMTQFGVAYVIAYAALRAGGARPIAPWERVGLVLLVLLAVVRAVAWSERLAVIELVLPYIVARLAFTRVRNPMTWKLGNVLPLLAPLLLYLMFTATEYFRSWESYRDQYDSLWGFSFDRLLTYYATASNNGIGLLAESTNWPTYTGRYVAEWLYMMPELGDALRSTVGDERSNYLLFLERFARPEFNNPSGLFPIVYDIGYAGSMAYFVLAGAVVGKLWDGWRRQAPAGVLGYPVALIFLTELLRFNYFASARFFPIAVALLCLWLVSRPTLPLAQRMPGARW